MKRKLITTVYAAFFLFMFVPLHAQNVGVGTTTPAAKLQVNHRSASIPGIRLIDSTNSGVGSLQFQNLSNTVKMNLSGFSGGNFNRSQYLDVRSDTNFITATFKGDGTVGIRNLDPAYPLDVNGSINTTGAILVNGNDGNAGQVLRSNGNGTMSWSDLSEFKNHEQYYGAGSNTWIVPAGVTRICVELWGGGGGATIYGGGGGGAYVRAYFTVTPGASLPLVVGTGGGGGNSSGSSGFAGSASTFTVGALQAIAGGGQASYNDVEDLKGEIPGKGGVFFGSGGFRNFIGIEGQPGTPNQRSYQQRNATTFVIVTKHGSGGDAGNSFQTGGRGSTTDANESSGSIIRKTGMTTSLQPGGGGGTSICEPIYCNLNGYGAHGVVIIHY